MGGRKRETNQRPKNEPSKYRLHPLYIGGKNSPETDSMGTGWGASHSRSERLSHEVNANSSKWSHFGAWLGYRRFSASNPTEPNRRFEAPSSTIISVSVFACPVI
jgi:hypothetical protein